MNRRRPRHGRLVGCRAVRYVGREVGREIIGVGVGEVAGADGLSLVDGDVLDEAEVVAPAGLVAVVTEVVGAPAV